VDTSDVGAGPCACPSRGQGATPEPQEGGHGDPPLQSGQRRRGKASDGGDIGCRYTPEMLEMLRLALELRRKGVIKF